MGEEREGQKRISGGKEKEKRAKEHKWGKIERKRKTERGRMRG